MTNSYRDDRPRARRGGGTRRERQRGVWEIRVAVGVDAAGRGRQRSWTVHGDETHAAAVQAELVADYGVRRIARPQDGEKLTVGELLARFVEAPHVWSPKTLIGYRSHARYLARDPLGRVTLARLSPSSMERAVARWVGELSAAGWCARRRSDGLSSTWN